MSRVEIIPVEYGKSVLPESMVFVNGAEDKNLPIVFKIYLLKTSGKLILVDAGCTTMPGFVMEDFTGPVKALEKIGVSAEDITDVVITHTHHDHVESVCEFKNAEIFVQKDEYEIGRQYFKENQRLHLFDDEAEVADGVKAVKIGGHSKGSCIVEIADGNYVIVGDECYKRACIEKQIPTGASFDIEKSRKFIKKYGNGAYKLLLCHDE